RLYGEHLRPFVEKYGLLSRGLDMRVSGAVREGGKHVAASYLRSLFQSDGTVRCHAGPSDSYDVVLVCFSEHLMRDVLDILANMGIYSCLSVGMDYRSDRKPYWLLSLGYKSERAKFLEQIGFVSSDKQDKLLASLEAEIRGKQIPEVRYETIRRIEFLG